MLQNLCPSISSLTQRGKHKICVKKSGVSACELLGWHVRGGKWEIVRDVPLNEFSRDKIDKSVAELKEEKSFVSDLL